MITRGFGFRLDIESAGTRSFYTDSNGVRRWKDSDKPVQDMYPQNSTDHIPDAKKMVRITGCKDSHRWYSNMIGQTVPYLGTTDTGEYKTREPSGMVNFVLVGDAELVEVSPDV